MAQTPKHDVPFTPPRSFELSVVAVDPSVMIDDNVLRAKIKKALEKQKLFRSNVELKRQLDKKYGFEGIIGGSEPMQNVFDTLRHSRIRRTLGKAGWASS